MDGVRIVNGGATVAGNDQIAAYAFYGKRSVRALPVHDPLVQRPPNIHRQRGRPSDSAATTPTAPSLRVYSHMTTRGRQMTLRVTEQIN